MSAPRPDRLAAFERASHWLAAPMLARVVSIDDPQNLARVQVELTALDGIDGQRMPVWARVVSPFAGRDRGAFFIPDVDDEVLVVFHNGDSNHPLVLGGLWNGHSTAPASIDSGGRNVHKVIRSKNGLQVTLDDEDGREMLRLETPGGQMLTLQDGPGSVQIEDSNGNSVTMETAGITITAAAKVTVQAPQVSVSAGMVQVDAGFSRFSGVVQCDTLISNAVVSASYTPGAGNVW